MIEIKIISACGNDCSICPRHLPKREEELKSTAELWYKIGYRDKIVDNEEIRCGGCAITNWCRYEIIQCTTEKKVENCSQCMEYKCKKIKECFKRTLMFFHKCKKVCTETEYEVLEKAFFEKEKNLDQIKKV